MELADSSDEDILLIKVRTARKKDENLKFEI